MVSGGCPGSGRCCPRGAGTRKNIYKMLPQRPWSTQKFIEDGTPEAPAHVKMTEDAAPGCPGTEKMHVLSMTDCHNADTNICKLQARLAKSM